MKLLKLNFKLELKSSLSGSTHYLERKEYTLREICEDTDDKQIKRIQRNKSKIGALWHLFHPNDIDKIR